MLALIAIQGSNAVLPLIIFPYSLHILGPDRYQDLVQGEAVSLLALSIVVYCFEVTGVAAVIGCHPLHDKDKIAREFSIVSYSRLLLFGITTPPLLLIIHALHPGLLPATAAWLMIPLSFAISPNWLFLGLQRNEILAVVTCGSRLAAVALVFAVIHGPADHLYVPLTIGGCYLLAALIALYVATRIFGARFVPVPWKDIYRQIIDGNAIFLANASVTLYRDLNVLILGVLNVPSYAVANYSIAEKFAKALQATSRPINQHLVPKAMALAKQAASPTRSLYFALCRLLVPITVLLTTVSAVMFLLIAFRQSLPMLNNIESYYPVALLASIMSIAGIFGSANSVLGMTSLSVLGRSRFLLIAVLLTGIVSLVTTFGLAFAFFEVGAAVGFVLGELLLFAIITWKFLNNHRSVGVSKQRRDF